jgi:hypothetical protein
MAYILLTMGGSHLTVNVAQENKEKEKKKY